MNLGRRDIDLAAFDDAAHFVRSGISVWSRKQNNFDLTRPNCSIGLSNPARIEKGAVPAHSGERLLIPLNMRYGALICSGKGNPEWNCSAPHGADLRKEIAVNHPEEEYLKL